MLGVVFMFIYLVKVINVQFVLRYDSWVMGEWLINYTAGFIRRGLLGEIFLTVDPFLNIHITSLVIVTKAILYIFIGVCFLWISGGFDKKLGVAELVLILAPWALMFDLIDIRGSGRKETILIAAFLIFLFIQRFAEKQEKEYSRWAVFWYLVFIFPILVLIHEGFFFFLPFFGLIIFLEDRTSLAYKLRILAIPFLSALFFFLWFYFQNPLDARQANQICLSLTERMIDEDICIGAVDALKYSLPEIPVLNYFKYYLPSLLLVTIPLLVFGLNTSGLGIKKITLAVFLPLAAILPLFWVSFDWGRWIHVYGMMILAVVLFKKQKDFSSKLPINFLNVLGMMLLGYVYLFTWRLKPFIGEGTNPSRMLFDIIKWLEALTGFNL